MFMLHFFLRLGFGLFSVVALSNAVFGLIGYSQPEGGSLHNGVKAFFWLSAGSASVAGLMLYLSRRVALMKQQQP
jgi:hypothetical protein